MHDIAKFFRQRVDVCFRRRRRYLVNSVDWKRCVEQTRMFIQALRDVVAGNGFHTEG
jgi:hypothetical protein